MLLEFAMNAELVYRISNKMMIGSLLIGFVGVLLGYILSVSMPLQIAGHIATVLAPALLKLGYVGRMASCVAAGRAVDC